MDEAPETHRFDVAWDDVGSVWFYSGDFGVMRWTENDEEWAAEVWVPDGTSFYSPEYGSTSDEPPTGFAESYFDDMGAP